MDEGLFLMILFCGFLAFAGIIWCFLSTCLGLEVRRSDLWEAFKPSALASLRQSDRDRESRARMARGEYHELDDMSHSYDRLGGGLGGDDMELMKRGGVTGRFY